MVVPGGVFVLWVEVVAEGIDVGEGIGNGWNLPDLIQVDAWSMEIVSAFGSAAE